ncbi:hypothetical protein D920_02757 [Enterococcus faecalis 13-SD-W-01]|nr:hypothetical protein D920_02757 [Enterococcus faecalis 13-SD-W-01]
MMPKKQRNTRISKHTLCLLWHNGFTGLTKRQTQLAQGKSLTIRQISAAGVAF